MATQNAAPDGHTLLTITGSAHAALPAMQAAPYDPVKGFTPITLLFRMPVLLVIPVDSPVKSVAELLELGRKKPGGLTFGSAGVGSTAHLLAAQIGRGTKTPITFVQYRGGAPLMADLITGRLDFAFASYTSARSNMEGGKLRALAVDAEERLPATPDVPTLDRGRPRATSVSPTGSGWSVPPACRTRWWRVSMPRSSRPRATRA